jgi:hypothetical protein
MIKTQDSTLVDLNARGLDRAVARKNNCSYYFSDMFDLATHVPDADRDLSKALRDKSDATKEVLMNLVRRGAPELLKDQVFHNFHKAQAEVRCSFMTCTKLDTDTDTPRSVPPCDLK